MTTRKLALLPLLILTLLLTSGLVTAQEQSPYDIALERIEDARVSGAQVLQLNNLGLETLPPEISQLKNLNVLTAFDNQLVSLPSEIGQLHNLTRLYVLRNQISQLPPEIGNLKELQIIDLSDNRLSSLPEEIRGLDKLCILALNNNDFRNLPVWLAETGTLWADWNCKIQVSDNPLITPPEDVVAQGTPAILDYLRNQAAMQAQQVTLAIAGMVGLVAAFLLAFRWKTQRPARKKKRD